MSKDQEIRELFKRHSVPLDRDDVWAVQGTPVVKHKALERLAAALNVHWHPPQILRSERDEAVILVSGSTGDGPTMEWSIGEALVQPMLDTGKKNNYGKPIYQPEGLGNYAVTPKQAAYPYAMAEKRGKDRVILKLAGLHGVYSSEEADSFKESPPEASEEQEAVRQPTPAKTHQRASNGATEGKVSKPSRQVYVDNSIERIAGFDDVAALLSWALTEKQKVWPQYGIDPHGEDGQRIVKAYKERVTVLEEAFKAGAA